VRVPTQLTQGVNGLLAAGFQFAKARPVFLLDSVAHLPTNLRNALVAGNDVDGRFDHDGVSAH
jgi:hypothetical protein